MWYWSPDSDFGVLGKHPSNLATFPTSQIFKGPSISGNSRHNWLAVMARPGPSQWMVMLPEQSHFLYQVLEEIIKGHMQIRQFLEFLCLKSESNSPTLLLESQMHLN